MQNNTQILNTNQSRQNNGRGNNGVENDMSNPKMNAPDNSLIAILGALLLTNNSNGPHRYIPPSQVSNNVLRPFCYLGVPTICLQCMYIYSETISLLFQSMVGIRTLGDVIFLCLV